MAISFFLDFKGPLQDLSRVKLRVSDGALRPAFKRIIEDYRAIMKETYFRQRTPGYRWPPNSLAYIRDDRYKGANPPGVRTGAVRRAHVTGRGRGAVEEIKDNALVAGTSLKYTNFSAAGPRRPRRDIRVDTFTEVFNKAQRDPATGRRGVVTGRKIPVRDPLLALYTPATRNIRKKIRERWQGYILEAVGDAISEQVSVRVSRPRRRSRRRR